MAKVYFYYSTMNAGKSTALLQSSYNYHERGMETVLFAPAIDDRYGKGKITSRIGLEAKAVTFSPSFDLFAYVKDVLVNQAIACVLVDEAHFLTKQQVAQLAQVSDALGVPVLAYGLRSDFQGESFEGSQYLLAWADNLIELKTICHCGRKATMNLRIDEAGAPVKIGEQVEIGGNDRYVATCREHFLAGVVSK